MSHNIECGNSLISGGEKELEKYFGKDWKAKKPFNWQEKFSDVFKQGGFDVIIGNPPYIKEFVDKSAFKGLYNSPYYQGKMDIWTMFGCVAIDLLKEGGLFGFIAPNNWLTNAGASIFRDKILSEGEIINFTDFGDFKVFDEAGIQTMIFIFKKGKPREVYNINYSKITYKNIAKENLIKFLSLNKKAEISGVQNFEIEFKPQNFKDKLISFVDSDKENILKKIESKRNFELKENEVGQGIVAAPDKYFLVKNINRFSNNEKHYLKKYYTSSGKFISSESKDFLFYISEKNFKNKNLDDFPNIKKHFEPHKNILKKARIKYGTPNKQFFYLHREREERFFKEGPKVVCGVRVIKPNFYYTEDEYYGSRALNFIKSDRINLKYLTGILNSQLVYFWLKNKGKQLGDLLQIDKAPLLNIPICISSSEDQKIIINLVKKITELNKKLRKLNSILDDEEYKELKSEIDKTDKEIDERVYKLYGLTEEEIRIVENSK